VNRSMGEGPSPRHRFLLTLYIASAVLTLSPLGCGLSGPPPAEYIIGTAPAPARVTTPLTGRPIIEVKPVHLPDYLDTRDLLVRSGNQVVASRSGRWAERLSVGMTRALAASIAARLRGVDVTTAAPVEHPTLQVLVDVTAFEASANQEVVLVARWAIIDGTGRSTLISEQTALTEPVASIEDSAVVTAMSRAVEDLARAIATGIERSSRPA
jgi:uncharacterized lipoprotein YmbA